MKIEVNGVRLFVDIDGAALVPDGQTLRERPVLLLPHSEPGMDHRSLKADLGSLRDVAQLVYTDPNSLFSPD